MCTLSNLNVEIYRRFLEGNMSFGKPENNKGKTNYKGVKKDNKGKPPWVIEKEVKGEWIGKPWGHNKKEEGSSNSDKEKKLDAASGEANKEAIKASMADATLVIEDDFTSEKEEARILEELKYLREERSKKGYDINNSENSGRSEISAKIYILSVRPNAPKTPAITSTMLFNNYEDHILIPALKSIAFFNNC